MHVASSVHLHATGRRGGSIREKVVRAIMIDDSEDAARSAAHRVPRQVPSNCKPVCVNRVVGHVVVIVGLMIQHVDEVSIDAQAGLLLGRPRPGAYRNVDAAPGLSLDIKKNFQY